MEFQCFLFFPYWSLVPSHNPSIHSLHIQEVPVVSVKEEMTDAKSSDPGQTALSCDLRRLYFVSCTAAPAFQVRQHFTLLPIHTWMHLAPPLLCNYGCVHTRWSRSCCPSNLSGEAGTFDRLGSLLNLVLVAAAVGGDHFTGPCFDMHYVTSV